MATKTTIVPSGAKLGKTHCVTYGSHCNGFLAAFSSGNLLQLSSSTSDGKYVNRTMKTNGAAFSVVPSKDGQWVVSGDSRGKVIVWSTATCRIAINISEHNNWVYTVDVSSDSTRVASGSYDCTARIFNIVSGVGVIPPLHHDGPVVGVRFSPDGSRLATATLSHASVRIYDSHSGNRLFDLPISVTCAEPITPLAWSPDGQQLFVGSPGKITAFDTTTSSHSEWPIHNGSTNVSIVISGPFIACSAGSSVSFWDYTSRTQIGSVIEHATAVNCISVCHNWRYLACGHDDAITLHNLGGFLPDAYLYALRRVPLMQVRENILGPWKHGNLKDAESMLSEEIAQIANPSHYTFAARSLVRVRLEEWKAAIEDAESVKISVLSGARVYSGRAKSLQIKRSPMGQIAKSLALAGAGEQEVALNDFDLAFRDGDQSDITFLLVIKSVLVFTYGKSEQAVSRLRALISSADESMQGHYIQILGNMYSKQGDYENVVQTLHHTKKPSSEEAFDPLVTLSLIFGWNFDHMEDIAWQRLCEALYASGRIKEVGETLLKMTNPSSEHKPPPHCRILEHLVTHSGEVTLLLWTGKSSTRHSCLPDSPAVYSQPSFIPPYIEQDEMQKRMDELRALFPLVDALIIYGRLTRLQPVRFIYDGPIAIGPKRAPKSLRSQLLLPCIVFSVTGLEKGQEDVYHAKTTGLGDVVFTTADSLPLKEPHRLVFADTRIHGLNSRYETEPIQDSVDTETERVHAPMIEEVPTSSSDAYARALQLMVQLGQPFSALLFLQEASGSYKRVAADHEIVMRGIGHDGLKDIRVEVLQIL